MRVATGDRVDDVVPARSTKTWRSLEEHDCHGRLMRCIERSALRPQGRWGAFPPHLPPYGQHTVVTRRADLSPSRPRRPSGDYFHLKNATIEPPSCVLTTRLRHAPGVLGVCQL